MTHPDEGTLQAFLDDELSTAERARLAEHLLVCDACQAAHQELLRANALFSRAISLTDVEPGLQSRPLAVRARSGTSAFIKAAILVLFVAATAAATVPGSPVREWIVETVTRERPVEETVTPAPAPPVAEPESSEPAPSPAGVFLPVTEPVVVSVANLEGSAIRLAPLAGDRVGVSMVGADRDPTFRTGPGRVEVRGGRGGELVVTLPAVGRARLEVGGRLYAEAVDGAVRIHVPAETAGSSVVWR